MASSSLANRVAVQRDPELRPQVTLREQLTSMTGEYQLALPRGMEATQLIRDALTCLSATPKLAECDAKSVLGGLMTCAQLGLRPAVLGQAWLLPMWDRKTGGQKATLVIGYQGYLELIHRSRRVAKVNAHKVYENDKYKVRYGDNESLKHRPLMFGDRGDVIAYYATAQLIPKATTFQDMTIDEMREHRDRFAMSKSRDGVISGPWRDHFDAMALKTVLLRLAKYLPKSVEMNTAMVADGGVRTDLSPRADIIDVTQEVEAPPALEAAPEDIPWAETVPEPEG